MIERTHIPEAPWWVVQAVDKKKARLNCIDHLLGMVPYHEVEHTQVELPGRVRNPRLHPPSRACRDDRAREILTNF